jgi:diguanylate cyclase (GGDEF)-like protein
MPKFRTALVAALVAAIVAPAATARAVMDSTEAIRELATEAAELITTEHALMGLVEIDVERGEPSADDQLRTVDRQAQAVLVQLDQLGVELTPAIRSTMGLLPRQTDTDTEPVDGIVPADVVYEAAIADLLRIAATPEAVAPVSDASNGQSFGLLAVAALSLVLLGLAALGSTLGRQDESAELAAMAWSDGLTGLANRRRLDHDLASQRDGGGGSTSIIMVDVDRFKAVNDTYGHQAGDDILRQVATMLSHHVRFDDVVYRYGGEEFCIVLPEATLDDARVVAKRIVEAARVIALPDSSHLTVSVGVADGGTDDIVRVVETADRALLEAKHNGRDCVVTATVPELTTA